MKQHCDHLTTGFCNHCVEAIVSKTEQRVWQQALDEVKARQDTAKACNYSLGIIAALGEVHLILTNRKNGHYVITEVM